MRTFVCNEFVRGFFSRACLIILTTATIAAAGMVLLAPSKSRADQPDGTAAAAVQARTLSGVLVDRAGYPVNNAYFSAPEVSSWKGPKSDPDGKFVTKDIPTKATVLVAWSQRLNAVAVIPIDPVKPSDTQYVVDCDCGSAELHVVDPNGLLVKNAAVTLRVSSPNGITYEWRSRPQDAERRVSADLLPAGRDWTISAKLPTGESTQAIPITAPGIVEMPDLVQNNEAPAGSPPVSKVLQTYSGRVEDENGQPISGVVLRLLGVGGLMTKTLGVSVTDANGRWSRRLAAAMERIDFRLSHPDYVGFHFEMHQPSPPIQSLRDGTAVQVMKRGMRVSGKVHDQAGNPVGNALVLMGWLYSTTPFPAAELIEDYTSARTSVDGTFTIGGIPSGEHTAVVLSDEYAPTAIQLNVTKEMQPVDIKLDGGHSIGGRIVDEEGQPLAGIVVGISKWHVGNRFSRFLGISTKTGSDGKFKAADLPREGSLSCQISPPHCLGVQFNIEADSDDVGNVIGYRNPVIEGDVVDGETGAAIKGFRVTDGFWDNGKFFRLKFDDPVQGQDGAFRRPIDRMVIDRDHEPEFVAKIAAPGYAVAYTPPIKLGQKYERFLVKLQKTTPCAGKVVMADGKPAVRARLYLVGSENETTVEGAGINEQQSYSPDIWATSDDDGKFELPSSKEPGQILVLHDTGYAIVPTESFTTGQAISLTPWGRIEGTYRPRGQPRPNVVVSATQIPAHPDGNPRDTISFMLHTSVDPEGRFVIDRVPSLPLKLTAEGNVGPATVKVIELKLGEIFRTTLAEDGPEVNGKVDLSALLAIRSPAVPNPYHSGYDRVRAIQVDPKPERPPKVDKAEWEAEFKSVLDFKAPDRLIIPEVYADLQPDGLFTFDALAPGKYVLLVDIRGALPGWGLSLAKGHAEFTVGEHAVTLPTVQVQAQPHPQRGDLAPGIDAKTVAGEAFALSSLHGKYVVLDFWNFGNRNSQKALKSIAEKYDGKVSIVGLNFDHSSSRASEAILSLHSTWPQLLGGSWDRDNAILVAYGLDVFPSLWLIDPEGRILGRDLTPDQFNATLEKELNR